MPITIRPVIVSIITGLSAARTWSPHPAGAAIIDWRDRIFHGYNQRWAYITVAASLRNDSEETKAAADAAIKNFIAELFPKIWKPVTPQG